MKTVLASITLSLLTLAAFSQQKDQQTATKPAPKLHPTTNKNALHPHPAARTLKQTQNTNDKGNRGL